jgi:xylitol oxidase
MTSSDSVGENWAGTFRYQAFEVISVHSNEELTELVRAARRIRALGSRHSFNDIADSPGLLVQMDALESETWINEERPRVKVPAGISYGTLGRFLQARGWALHNMGSLPHISVAGACATGTHGSGATNQSLAAAVCEIELIDGHGQLIHLDDENTRFPGAVVALGALGIVTSLTLRIEPTFEMRQDVYVDMPWSDLGNMDEIMNCAYSVSLFTRWAGIVDLVWTKSRCVDGAHAPKMPFRGATPSSQQISPTGDSPENTTDQCGVSGPWNERLPHFRFDKSPSHGDEIQSEYFVSREHGLDALRALERISHTFTPHLLISELRYVAADQLWLSPAYERDSLAIHFTWKKHPAEVWQLLQEIEKALKPFDGRPHWGKWFTMDASRISNLYQRLPDFAALVHEFDPSQKFNNDFLNRVIFVK